MNQENRPTELCILKGARELISDEKKWTKNWFAKDSGGFDVDFDSPEADRWCAYGAMEFAAKNCGEPLLLGHAEGIFKRSAGTTCTSYFNDTHTHAEVLAAFDKAILAASPEPPTSATEGR